MSRIAALALLLGLHASVAQADPRGIVARVVVGEGASGSPTMVRLTPNGETEGDPVEIELNDAGEAPDVEPEDGIFSGALWVEGETFDVTIVDESGERPGGTVEWEVDDEQRDLNITLLGDEITVSAEVKQPLPPQPDGSPSGENYQPEPGEEGGPPPEGPQGSGGGGPNGGQPMALGTGEQPDGSALQSSSGLQIFGLLLGILAIIAVVWWWRQPEEDDDLDHPLSLPEGLSLVPEAGFLGAGTPSLSGGVTVFKVSRADANALVGPLLGTVAQGRTVALAAPGTLTVPSVLGGPVYTVQGGKVDELKDALTVLSRSGRSRAVGFLVAEGFDAAARAALAKGLPAGVGVAVLAVEPSEDLGEVAISVKREGASPEGAVKYGQCWVFSVAGSLVDAVEGPQGLTRLVEA